MSETAAIELNDQWVGRLVEASASLDLPDGLHSAVVAIAIGKTESVAIEIVDGRVVGSAEGDAAQVTVPVTADQLTAFCDGSESLARAYMEGDVKPVGSTGALVALVEVFERPEFIDQLTA